MASLHNFGHKIRKEQTSWVDSLGQKIKYVAEFAGTAKVYMMLVEVYTRQRKHTGL